MRHEPDNISGPVAYASDGIHRPVYVNFTVLAVHSPVFRTVAKHNLMVSLKLLERRRISKIVPLKMCYRTSDT
jgi:hypothetical protein